MINISFFVSDVLLKRYFAAKISCGNHFYMLLETS